MTEELKHYTHMALIDTGIPTPPAFREIAQLNAQFYNQEYVEIPGSVKRLQNLIDCDYTKKMCIIVEPGQAVTSLMVNKS